MTSISFVVVVAAATKTKKKRSEIFVLFTIILKVNNGQDRHDTKINNYSYYDSNIYTKKFCDLFYGHSLKSAT